MSYLAFSLQYNNFKAFRSFLELYLKKLQTFQLNVSVFLLTLTLTLTIVLMHWLRAIAVIIVADSLMPDLHHFYP